MIRFKVTSTPARLAIDNFRRPWERSLEAASLYATDAASRDALRDLRATMSAAGLRGLGQAFAQKSDLAKTGRVFRTPTGWRTSGFLYVRTRSERTLGAIESYTKGADIVPRGRWLWIATDEIPRKAGRYRMTPARYRSQGFEQKIGPLVQITGINGNPLLIVNGASVSAAGLKRKARSRLKSGGLRRGQREKETIVAFIGIPRTRRAARLDVGALIAANAARLPALRSIAFQQGVIRAE